MPGTNYNAEMSWPPYKCVYLESDIASYHYASCEEMNAASRPQKIKGKKKNKLGLCISEHFSESASKKAERRSECRAWLF